jgi:hypothetical protein
MTQDQHLTIHCVVILFLAALEVPASALIVKMVLGFQLLIIITWLHPVILAPKFSLLNKLEECIAMQINLRDHIGEMKLS